MNANYKNYIFKKATAADIEELVKTRIIVLRAANQLPETEDMSAVETSSRHNIIKKPL